MKTWKSQKLYAFILGQEFRHSFRKIKNLHVFPFYNKLLTSLRETMVGSRYPTCGYTNILLKSTKKKFVYSLHHLKNIVHIYRKAIQTDLLQQEIQLGNDGFLEQNSHYVSVLQRKLFLQDPCQEVVVEEYILLASKKGNLMMKKESKFQNSPSLMKSLT